MINTVWAYGTRKPVTVDRVAKNILVCVERGTSDGFILIGDRSGAKVGDEGYIEFKQGGPTGGFWEFHKGSLLIIPGQS